MAIAITDMTAGQSQSDSTTYTTASVTLTAGRLYLLGTDVTRASPNANIPSAVATTTGGVAFTACDAGIGQTGPFMWTSVWRHIPSSTTTETITITRSSATGAAWQLVEVTGMDTSGTNGSGAILQINSTTGANPHTTTLTNPITAGNGRFSMCGTSVNAAPVAAATGGTWTQTSTSLSHSNPNCGARGAWNATPATGDNSVTWTQASSTISTTLLEIKAAAAAGGETEFLGEIPV